MRDSSGLQYHRARHYRPSLGIFASRDPFEGMAGRPMSLNGYSWVEGNVVNAVDPTGHCAQPTQWWNPIDVNCYYSAAGLAQRFSQGNANAYDSWFNVLIQKSWGELKAIEAMGTSADATGTLNQFMTNSSILPSLLAQNPALAVQALQQWGCQNNINLSFLGVFAAVGTAGTLSGGAATGGVTIGGAPLVWAALGGLSLAFLISALFAGTATDTDTEEDPCDDLSEPDPSSTVVSVVGMTGDIRPSQDVIYVHRMMEYARKICKGEPVPPTSYYQKMGLTTDRIIADGHHRFVAYRYRGVAYNLIPLVESDRAQLYPEDLEEFRGLTWASVEWNWTIEGEDS